MIVKILHALGLLHEHQRPDRDDYIYVDMLAVQSSGLSDAFRKAWFEMINHGYCA